jgi:hypothetical protein
MHIKALLGLACPSYSRFGCVLSCGQECPATLHQDQLCKLLAHVVQLAVAARSGLLVPACPLPEPCELTPALPVVISVRHVQPAHCGHASIDACRHCGNVGGRAGIRMGRWREGWRHSCGVRHSKPMCARAMWTCSCARARSGQAADRVEQCWHRNSMYQLECCKVAV